MLRRISDTVSGVSHREVDVVIVGARCAGSAAGAVFARRGRRVLMLDKSALPSEALSSHTLFAGTLDEFSRIGAMPYYERLDPPDLKTVKLHTFVGDESAHFTETWPAGRRGMVSSARRYLLDRALLDCARDAGAQALTEAKVESIVWRGGRAAGVVYRRDGEQVTVRAKLVLGADGQFSTVAELVDAQPYRWSHSYRAAMLRYYVDPATEDPEATTIHHSRRGSSLSFVFPTTPRGQTVVMFIDAPEVIAAARRDPEPAWQRSLALHPALEARYTGASAEPVKFHDRLTSYFRPATGPGWALLGDAGHFKDPIIGQGIRDAVWSGRTVAERTAELLDSPAAVDAELRRWEQTRDRECAPVYLAGLMESRTMGDTRGVAEFVTELDRRQLAIIGPFGARGPGLVGRWPKRELLGALAQTVRRSPDPRRTLAELGGQGGQLIGGMIALRHRPFRSRRPHPWEQPVRSEE
jgi:flavin-dependent dehydrogenase